MKDLQNRGWVRLHRKIEENDLWFLEPFTKAQAWIDLFLNANHKDNIIQIRGNIINIKRGQIGWSELTMCKRWKWSKGKVRNYLKMLETIQQIIQQKSSLTTIITILKYEEYQTDDTTDKTAERQQTVKQKDSRQYTNKNDKNDKNEKNILPAKADGKNINLLIEKFKSINPSYEILFKNTTQRKTLERMVKKYTYEKVGGMIDILPEIVCQKYAPQISTPIQLENKLGQLLIFIKQNKKKKGEIIL